MGSGDVFECLVRVKPFVRCGVLNSARSAADAKRSKE
jgi:hypothetical protein